MTEGSTIIPRCTQRRKGHPSGLISLNKGSSIEVSQSAHKSNKLKYGIDVKFSPKTSKSELFTNFALKPEVEAKRKSGKSHWLFVDSRYKKPTNKKSTNQGFI